MEDCYEDRLITKEEYDKFVKLYHSKDCLAKIKIPLIESAGGPSQYKYTTMPAHCQGRNEKKLVENDRL